MKYYRHFPKVEYEAKRRYGKENVRLVHESRVHWIISTRVSINLPWEMVIIKKLLFNQWAFNTREFFNEQIFGRVRRVWKNFPYNLGIVERYENWMSEVRRARLRYTHRRRERTLQIQTQRINEPSLHNERRRNVPKTDSAGSKIGSWVQFIRKARS
jgi:hypothetical protein